MPLNPIPLADADLAFDSAWLGTERADALFAALLAGVEWRTHRIRMFGREVDSPRRSCWIGDPGVSYRYSGVRFEPNPWPRVLLPLRARLRGEVGIDFNSVLANLYRDGSDRMGWHSDDEPELGPRPCIASVSLGAPRRFLLKRRDGGERLAVELGHGSLLLMRGDTQHHYRHALPATARTVGPRINLTFRRVAADR